jgi:hypothetical protein
VDQTSGTSNFGDHPISGTPDLTVRSDDDDIYTWEKERADDWVLRKAFGREDSNCASALDL